MKIFNKEMGKDVVYVQGRDLEYIAKYGDKIPKELIKRNYKELAKIEDKFNTFYEKETVDFFKKVKWIADYRDFYNLTTDEIFNFVDIKFEEYYRNFNEIYNDLDENKQYSKKDIGYLGQYYLNSILEVPKLREDYHFKIVPLISDSEGFNYESNNICISKTLLPKCFMVYSRSGRNINSNKVLNESLKILIAYFNDNNINWNWESVKNQYSYYLEITPDGKNMLLKFDDIHPIAKKENSNVLLRILDRNLKKR